MSTLQDLYTAAPSTEILVEGYDLQANAQGYFGTIRFWFLGADLFGFTSTVTGKSQTITINGVSVTRLIPLKHPYITSGCYADDVRVYPAPGSVASTDSGSYTISGEPSPGGISFTDYFCDVHFSTPAYPMESGDYPTVQTRLSGGQEMVTRPGSAYEFPSDGKRINHDVGVPVKVVEFGLTMNRLASLDKDTYCALAGCVNLTEFWGRPEGTVLYDGPNCEGEFMLGGLPSYTVTHNFKYRSIPWNQIMRPDGAGFEAPVEVTEVTDDITEDEDITDPRYMLPEGELNDLWGD
jgi:hypothetical protein